MSVDDSRDWHFWSTDPAAASRLGYPDAIWLPEAGFFSPPSQSDNAIPVHEYYSELRQHHFWTTNLNEFSHPDFNYTGIGYWVYDLAKPMPVGARTLERYVKSDQGDNFQHLWTATPEIEILDSWRHEGSIGYVFPAGSPPPMAGLVEVHRWGLTYPAWTCSILNQYHGVEHVEDIGIQPRDLAEKDCRNRLQNWAAIAGRNPQDYTASISKR